MDSQAPETLGLGVHCRSPGFPHLLLISYISSLQTQESSATWYCLATVRLNRIFSFSLFFLWRAVVMSRGYSSLLRERRLLQLVLNTHIGVAAKRRLPPLLWEVTIRQLHSGKTKRKALLKDAAKWIHSSWSHAQADPLHTEVLLWASGLGIGVSPRSQNRVAADRWGWCDEDAPSQMPPDAKDFSFSENPCQEARLRSAVTLKWLSP